MTPYAGTNFFTNLLVDLPQREAAEKLAATVASGTASPLPVTWLLRIEVVNALQQCLFLSRHGAQRLRVTPDLILIIEAQFFDDTERGSFMRDTPLLPDALECLFRQLSHRHTGKHGFRTYDILHVAAALALGCDTFWSFDPKAGKLAHLEGLRTNAEQTPFLPKRDHPWVSEGPPIGPAEKTVGSAKVLVQTNCVPSTG